jgi:acetyl esterase/lipase
VIRAFHARGISVASCNYRLAQSGPLPQPLHDGARAIQFLRSKAGEWKIDSQRVAAGGHSAGGLMALWLATHDDLANPASADPIARLSTRITCAATSDAPTNLDATVVFGWFGVKSLQEYPSTKDCFAIQSLDELTDPRRLRGKRRPLQKRPRAGKLPRRRGLRGAEIWPEINWLSGSFTFPRQPGFLAFFPTLEINPKNPLTL